MDLALLIIVAIVAVILGVLIGLLVTRSKSNRYQTKSEMLEQDKTNLVQELKDRSHQILSLTNDKTSLLSECASLHTEVDNLHQKIVDARDTLSATKKQYEDLLNLMRSEGEKREKDISEQFKQQLVNTSENYEKRLSQIKQHHEQQLQEFRSFQKEQMGQQMVLIREQMNSASEKILKERSMELAASNQEQLATILNPLKENIKQMKDAVEKSDREQTTTMERLDASIKENLKQAKEVGERADKLAQALTSENKTQGNFGELRLKQLLESMGLEEGVQFEEQTAIRDEKGSIQYDEGHRLIPDVILHFPDNRDVIIDSKISLSAFQDYYNADSEDDRKNALHRHIASVRTHVQELSRKNYSHNLADNRRKLDFVMMYVFSESALQLALSNDPSLWKDAYDKGVIISGSQNLYMMLRILEMTWRQVRQVENQHEIMKTANLIVERVQMFYERFQTVDEQLKKTQDAFDKLKNISKQDGASITTAAKNLLKYGAQENAKKKKLPKAD